MNIYICLCICVCVQTCISIPAYTNMYVLICIGWSMYVYLKMCIHASRYSMYAMYAMSVCLYVCILYV